MTVGVKAASVVIVGGGVAGLSAAWHLAEQGVTDVVLLEAEDVLASHSSARNAAIHMPLEESLTACAMAQRSRELIDSLLGTGWLDANGVVYVARTPDALDELRFWARQTSAFYETWPVGKLHSRVPLLDPGPSYHALAVPLAGVMDIDRLLQLMIRRARRAGAQLCTRARVAAIEVKDGAIAGCVLDDGHFISTEYLVIACGAWAGTLGALLDCPLPLTPLKRHLALLEGDNLHDPSMPVVWQLEEDVYFRPESGGILASPCDETPNRPELPHTDDERLELLGRKLSRLSTRFEQARVRRAWACLRTMAPDREAVIGADPRVKGLYWHAALGGRGMTIGAAAGEVLAYAVIGRAHPMHDAVSPARLL